MFRSFRTAAVLAGLAAGGGPTSAQNAAPTSNEPSHSLKSLALLTGVPIPVSRAQECLLQSADGSFATGARLPAPIHHLFDLPRLHDERFQFESHGSNHSATLTNAGYHVTAGGVVAGEEGYWILSCSGNRARPSELHGAYVSELCRIRGEVTQSVRSLAIDFLSESAEFWLRARTGEPLRWSTRLHGDFGDLLVRYHQEDGSAAWYSLSRPGEIEIRIGAAFDHKTGRRLVQAELVSPAAVAEFSFGQFQQSSWIDAALRLCNDTGELSLRGRGSYNRNEGFHYQLLIEMGLTF